MLRITTLALFSLLSGNALAFNEGPARKRSERVQKPVNLATISRSQMEAFGKKWPVRHKFSKKDSIWRWYDAKGNVVARLRRTKSNGKGLPPFSNGAVFTQGASDFRYVRIFRNGRKIGAAGWYLTKDGKWTLLYSRWQRKPDKDAPAGKQSYRRFWNDAYKVLADKQRRALEELRGPPLKKDDNKPSATPRIAGDVIGTVLSKPVSRTDIRKEFRLKHELSRLFLVPVLDKYKAAHRKEIAVTEKEIARLIQYEEQRAKQKGGEFAAARRRTVAQEQKNVKRFLPVIEQKLARKDLKPAERKELLKHKRRLELTRKQPGRSFVVWYFSRLKFQQYLYRHYGGGRVLWQQAGPEAFDAMHRWLNAREKAGDFQITDPALRAKFYEYWKNTKMHGAFLSKPKDKTNPVPLRFP